MRDLLEQVVAGSDQTGKPRTRRELWPRRQYLLAIRRESDCATFRLVFCQVTHAAIVAMPVVRVKKPVSECSRSLAPAERHTRERLRPWLAGAEQTDG